MAQMNRRLVLMGLLLSSAGPFQFGYLVSVFNQPEETIKTFIEDSHFQQYGDSLEDEEVDLMFSMIICMMFAGMFVGGFFLTRPALDGLGTAVLRLSLISKNFLYPLTWTRGLPRGLGIVIRRM